MPLKIAHWETCFEPIQNRSQPASMWIQIQIKKQQWNEWESYIDSFGFNIVYTFSIYYTSTRLYTYTHTPTERTYVLG